MSSPLNVPFAVEGKQIPAAGQLVEILATDQNTAYTVVQINAVNSGQASADIAIAISAAATADAVQRVDYIETGDNLKPNGRYTNFGLIVMPGQRVFASSSTGSVIFRATGLSQIQ